MFQHRFKPFNEYEKLSVCEKSGINSPLKIVWVSMDKLVSTCIRTGIDYIEQKKYVENYTFLSCSYDKLRIHKHVIFFEAVTDHWPIKQTTPMNCLVINLLKKVIPCLGQWENDLFIHDKQSITVVISGWDSFNVCNVIINVFENMQMLSFIYLTSLLAK